MICNRFDNQALLECANLMASALRETFQKGQGFHVPTRESVLQILARFDEISERTVTTGRATGIAHETVQSVTAGETAQCLGCDSLSCNECFARHAEELGYIKNQLDAAKLWAFYIPVGDGDIDCAVCGESYAEHKAYPLRCPNWVRT